MPVIYTCKKLLSSKQTRVTQVKVNIIKQNKISFFFSLFFKLQKKLLSVFGCFKREQKKSASSFFCTQKCESHFVPSTRARVGCPVWKLNKCRISVKCVSTLNFK